MSRLDRHVAAVQNKLALDRFVAALAWVSVALAAMVWLTILVDRVFQVRPPRWDLWFWSGIGAAVVAAVAYAVYRRPSTHAAGWSAQRRANRSISRLYRATAPGRARPLSNTERARSLWRRRGGRPPQWRGPKKRPRTNPGGGG